MLRHKDRLEKKRKKKKHHEYSEGRTKEERWWWWRLFMLGEDPADAAAIAFSLFLFTLLPEVFNLRVARPKSGLRSQEGHGAML